MSAHLQSMKHLACSACNLAAAGRQDGHGEGRCQQLRMLREECSQALRVRVPPAALPRRRLGPSCWAGSARQQWLQLPAGKGSAWQQGKLCNQSCSYIWWTSP